MLVLMSGTLAAAPSMLSESLRMRERVWWLPVSRVSHTASIGSPPAMVAPTAARKAECWTSGPSLRGVAHASSMRREWTRRLGSDLCLLVTQACSLRNALPTVEGGFGDTPEVRSAFEQLWAGAFPESEMTVDAIDTRLVSVGGEAVDDCAVDPSPCCTLYHDFHVTYLDWGSYSPLVTFIYVFVGAVAGFAALGLAVAPTTVPPALPGDVYVKQSPIVHEHAGGGAFASRDLPAGHCLFKHDGVPATAAQMNAPDFVKGYAMRRGAPFIDAFDRDGKLVMEDGRRLSVVDFTKDDWERLVGRGVAWEGKANLLRFFNEVPEPKEKGAASVAYSKGWWHTTRAVKKGEELLVWKYGSDYGLH